MIAVSPSALELLAEPRLLVALAALRLPSLWTSLTLGYFGVGAAMAWHLGHRGHGLGTATTAVVCWPLLLGLIGRPPPRGELDLGAEPPGVGEHGPKHARIEACVANLRRGLGEDLRELKESGGGAPLVDAAQLAKLTRSLHRADQRIARVDRLLHESEAQRQLVADAALDAAIASLRRARDHAEAELEAVLAGLVSLRVQLGLFALAGEGEPVRERLAELEARVAALAELSSIELAQVQP
jgi:hypothetical protein